MNYNEHPITPSLKQNCVREISAKDNCRNSLMSKFPQGTYRLTECVHTAVEVFRELILDRALNFKMSGSPNPCTKAPLNLHLYLHEPNRFFSDLLKPQMS